MIFMFSLFKAIVFLIYALLLLYFCSQLFCFDGLRAFHFFSLSTLLLCWPSCLCFFRSQLFTFNDHCAILLSFYFQLLRFDGLHAFYIHFAVNSLALMAFAHFDFLFAVNCLTQMANVLSYFIFALNYLALMAFELFTSFSRSTLIALNCLALFSFPTIQI